MIYTIKAHWLTHAIRELQGASFEIQTDDAGTAVFPSGGTLQIDEIYMREDDIVTPDAQTVSVSVADDNNAARSWQQLVSDAEADDLGPTWTRTRASIIRRDNDRRAVLQVTVSVNGEDVKTKASVVIERKGIDAAGDESWRQVVRRHSHDYERDPFATMMIDAFFMVLADLPPPKTLSDAIDWYHEGWGTVIGEDDQDG